MVISVSTTYTALGVAIIVGLPLLMLSLFSLLRAIGVILNIFWFSMVHGGTVTGHWQEVLQRAFVAGITLFLALLMATPALRCLGYSWPLPI